MYLGRRKLDSLNNQMEGIVYLSKLDSYSKENFVLQATELWIPI